MFLYFAINLKIMHFIVCYTDRLHSQLYIFYAMVNNEKSERKMTQEEQNKKQKLLEELCGLGDMIRGSLVHGKRKCGKKSCSCSRGGEGHPFNYLSISTTHARNRLVYVSSKNLERVERSVAAYHRAWEIIEELSALNIAELKTDKSPREACHEACEPEKQK